MPKQIQLSVSTLKRIAEALFLAYTEEQAAYLGGISKRTLARIRQTELWQEILRRSLEMERPYREKVWRGTNGWQGAAWMLERKYASQLARPEIQLQVNASTNTTNQTLVITTEQAADFKTRNASIDAELEKLSPPARRQDMLAQAIARDSQSSLGASASIDASLTPNKEGTGGAPGTRTPVVPRLDPEPNLTPNSNSVETSRKSKSKTESPAVENSRNSRSIPPEGMLEAPELPKRRRSRVVGKRLKAAPRGPKSRGKKR